MRYFMITHVKQPNGSYNEFIGVDDKVRRRHETEASVILDFEKRKVVKNRYRDEDGTQRTFDEIVDYYKQHYGDLIAKLEAKYKILEGAEEHVKEILGQDVPVISDNTLLPEPTEESTEE